MPKKVIELKGKNVTVENPAGEKQEAVSDIKLEIGDFCLTQKGIVIEKLDKKYAEEFIKILNEEEVHADN